MMNLAAQEMPPNYPIFQLDIEHFNPPPCFYSDLYNIRFLNKPEKFSLLLLNIRSVRKNFLNFISYFQDYLSSFTCIVIVETWLLEEHKHIFKINGFKCLDTYRSNFGGGIRLYYKCNMSVELLSNYTNVNELFEMLSVEIVFGNNKFICCIFYHPPTPFHDLNYQFIEHCNVKMMELRNRNMPIITCGDFNLNLLNPNRHQYINNFIQTLLECGLYPIINIPTKYNHNNITTKYSIIDQIWTNRPSIVTNSYVIPHEIADHFPVAATFNFTDRQTQVQIPKRNFSHINNLQFSEALSNMFPEIVDDDVHSTFSNYYLHIFNAYNSAYPVIFMNEKCKHCPWVTTQIKQCIKKKSKLYRLFLMGKISRQSYTVFRNRLTALLRRAKKLYHLKLFLKNIRNSSKTWAHINSIMGESKKSSLQYIKVDNAILRGTDMANYINSYFANIANDLTLNMINNEPFYHITQPNLHTCLLTFTDIEETLKVIKSLKNKSNGLDDINVVCIKNNRNVFAIHMTFLYNFSIVKQTFPDMLEVGKILPFYKAGAKDKIDNYRPISNLPVFSKVFEKLTLIRLNSFVNKYSLLSESQYGFRRGKNITQAAAKLTTLINKSYHNKYFSVCFFLDLRKAFDIVDHDILLAKLYHMGIRGPFYEFLKSYLVGRKQYVQIDNHISDKITISKGVPQGSILGPLLFCLYINDIVSAVDCEVILFADDAAFFITATTLQQLYAKINKLFIDLVKYLSNNKLVANINKSKLMLFSSRLCPNPEPLTFGGEVIEWVSEFKYLGLTLSNKMSYATHIENISTKVSQYIGVFYSINKIVPRHILLLLYFSYVVPHLTLHIILWGAAPEYLINKLAIKQNKILRAILNIGYTNGIPRTGTRYMYRVLNILNIKQLFTLQLFKFMVQLVNGELPYFYSIILQPNESNHGYLTRFGQFRHPLLTCEIERRGLSHQILILFDKTPLNFYENMSIKAAIFKYKRFLLDDN